MILSSSLGLRLNSDKGTKTLTGFFGTFCAGRTFGDSAAPKIDACLVRSFEESYTPHQHLLLHAAQQAYQGCPLGQQLTNT